MTTTKGKQRDGADKPSTESTHVKLDYVRRAVDLSELTRSRGAANDAPVQKKLPPAPGRVPSNNEKPVPLKDVLNPKQRRQD